MAKPNRDNKPNITDELAARRFHQIATLERQLAITADAMAAASGHLKELKQAHDGLIQRLRTAARNEGELPLFDLDSE